MIRFALGFAVALVFLAQPAQAQVTAPTSWEVFYCFASEMPVVCPPQALVNVPLSAAVCNLIAAPVIVPPLANPGKLEFKDEINSTATAPKVCQLTKPPLPPAAGIYNVLMLSKSTAFPLAVIPRSDPIPGGTVSPPQPPAQVTGLTGRP